MVFNTGPLDWESSALTNLGYVGAWVASLRELRGSNYYVGCVGQIYFCVGQIFLLGSLFGGLL